MYVPTANYSVYMTDGSVSLFVVFSALFAIARPLVSLSVTRVDQSKTVEVRIMQFSPQSSRILLVLG